MSISVAHCGDETLVALATDRPVGVDLERHRSVFGLLAVAARLMEPDRAAATAALLEHRRTQELLWWWTRAEAYGKARGAGRRAPAGLALTPSSGAPAAVRAGRT